MTLSPDIAALRWGLVAQALIRHRDELLWLAKPADDNGRLDTTEQKDCFRRAARSLGPAIAEAVKHRNEHEDRQYPPRPQLPPLEVTDQTELTRIGKEASSKSMLGMTNLEMSACTQYAKDQQRAAIERDGCCGGTPMQDGICFGIGQCPRFFEAERCAAFVAGYIEWLDEINEQTALAAIAARLSVSSSEPELSNV